MFNFLYKGCILESNINNKYSSQEIARIIDNGIKKSEIRKLFIQQGNLQYNKKKKMQAEFCRFIGFCILFRNTQNVEKYMLIKNKKEQIDYIKLEIMNRLGILPSEVDERKEEVRLYALNNFKRYGFVFHAGNSNIIKMVKIMKVFKYKNIKLTKKYNKANFVTHSGTFHVDDVISTIFLSKIFKKINLIRIPSMDNRNTNNKLVFDIGLGKFDHHQKNRNGKRENGIYYSSIGLLWKKYGKEYLKNINAKNIDKVYEYMDKELIQYIDATDNMQMEYLKSKTSPDFVKLYNPEWNENVTEEEGFIRALKSADEFWNIYIKHAIAEVEAIEIIVKRANETNEHYVIFDKELPYRKAINLLKNRNIKYLIFKSKRKCYDIRIIDKEIEFKKEIVINDIKQARILSNISDLLYVDTLGKLCCTKTLNSAINLVKYNDKKQID